MDPILAQKDAESTTSAFMKWIKIGQILKSCNFSKHAGFAASMVLEFLVNLRFTQPALSRFEKFRGGELPFGVDVACRFLGTASTTGKGSWGGFLPGRLRGAEDGQRGARLRARVR
jgi:hypothetical protein